MRTAALVFFYGCLCAGAFRAFMGWARRTVTRHVAAGLRDPRIDITLATALWKQHEAEWEDELARPYDWQQEGL